MMQALIELGARGLDRRFHILQAVTVEVIAPDAGIANRPHAAFTDELVERVLADAEIKRRFGFRKCSWFDFRTSADTFLRLRLVDGRRQLFCAYCRLILQASACDR